jgi:hypothetical protein
VISSVIFNLNIQFNKKNSKTRHITLITFQFVGEFVCKEEKLIVQLRSKQFFRILWKIPTEFSVGTSVGN